MMNTFRPPLQEIFRSLVHLLCEQRTWAVGAFVGINLVALGFGLTWSKAYTASTTILIQEQNVIQPLMQGAAVAAQVKDHAVVAQQVLFGRRILSSVIEYGGWAPKGATELEKDRAAEVIKGRTKIISPGQGLLRIEVRDSSPERAYRTTQRFADLFVSEAAGAQTKEVSEAYSFIDNQVKEYGARLKTAEEGLKEFGARNADARPGSQAEVSSRITALQATIEKTTVELKEAQVRRDATERQLHGEAGFTASLTREGQIATRVAELQGQLDHLRLSYHDSYPDIIRIKHQIEDLKAQVVEEQAAREQRRNNPGDSPLSASALQINPMYQQLRKELFDASTLMNTLQTRLTEARSMLASEMGRARRVSEGEAMLAQLTRDYQVNRDMYQDLLKRRESAHVSRSLDAGSQGLNVRIQEPASVPVRPDGLRFADFVGLGLVLGIFVPVGAAFALLQFDPRIRSRALISEKLGVPLITGVVHTRSRREWVQEHASIRKHLMAMAATFGFIVLVALLRAVSVI